MKTLYSHGVDFYECTYCDKKLTVEEPGKRVCHIADKIRYIEHLCTECFDDPEFQDIVKNYSFKYGMAIRSFPQNID